MNIRVVLNVLGSLLIFLGLAVAVPVSFSVYYGDADVFALGCSAGGTIIVGVALHFANRKHHDIRIRESIAIVSLGWIVCAAAGALPFCLYSESLSFTDAFFEVMSGLTTTGASILTDIEALPHGLLFWRSLTHWLGGMGIIVLSLAILPTLGVGGMQLFKAEVPGPSLDKIRPRIQQTAKLLWGVYVLLTLVQTVLLLLGGMNLFDALCHTFGTMATGGFSTRNASMAAFPSAYLQTVVTVFMFLAGVNFTLHYKVLTGNWRACTRDSELRLYFAVSAISVLLIVANLVWFTKTWHGRTVLDAAFQVVSIITTTGFASVDYEQWPFLSQGVLMGLMLVGGCAGSTAGGIKVIRILLLNKFTFIELKRILHPSAIIPVRVGGNAIADDIVARVLGFVALYVFLLLAGAFLLAALGNDLATSLSAAIATLGNIGPGFAGVGPTENFAHFSIPAKWLLAFLMLLGRLELYTLLTFLSASYWKK